jgi:hypothetical protein
LRAATTSFVASGLILAAAVGVTPALADPQTDYILNCMGCHVANGSGAAGKVPSMRESLVPLSSTPEGRRYLIQVPGASQSPLSDRALANLLSWMVRSLSSVPVPKTFIEFTAAEVGAVRKTPLVHVRETRARLLAETAPER